MMMSQGTKNNAKASATVQDKQQQQQQKQGLSSSAVTGSSPAKGNSGGGGLVATPEKKIRKKRGHAKSIQGIRYGNYQFNKKMEKKFGGDMEKAAEQQLAELGLCTKENKEEEEEEVGVKEEVEEE